MMRWLTGMVEAVSETVLGWLLDWVDDAFAREQIEEHEERRAA